ncbi:MAG TPA: sigma-54 dependent transcriptional regulator [Planctomycetota bacterium]|nr:sigma-54 dependent transcriptional regulator [Planctomycetota bacterium]
MSVDLEPARVLIVDDERDLAESCAYFVERAGMRATVAVSGDQALDLLDRTRFDLVITDLRMPRMSGLGLLDAIKSRDPDIEVLLITGYPDIETAVAAIKKGAFDYVTKPFGERDLMERVGKALGRRQRRQPGGAGPRLIYRSELYGKAVEMIERAARTDASVLILGESGTGKEVLAQHLHRCSLRRERPFVPVECAAIPENLFESELFGHVKGAFSGATATTLGLFEVAHGGTLFLDEVGELPLSFQPKLLRALQERQVRRVGDHAYRQVDVRLVCATNRALDKEVEAGRFRGDLFYRIDVVRIEVPPLRDRPEDVEVLVEHFLNEFTGDRPSGPLTCSREAMTVLAAYRWPGNTRQLRNAIERACALARGPEITVDDLPAEIVREGKDVAGGPETTESFQEMKARKIAAIEINYISALLRRHDGNVTHCAQQAGMSRSAFQKLMQRYDIKSSDFRAGDRAG